MDVHVSMLSLFEDEELLVGLAIKAVAAAAAAQAVKVAVPETARL
jgi:hypothetical protein